ncbi:MAG: extracellular solute-binding protein [Clostridiaceae bacterium]|nr:extracellular solute-binding protein [Clostridiaceae bacterium]
MILLTAILVTLCACGGVANTVQTTALPTASKYDTTAPAVSQEKRLVLLSYQEADEEILENLSRTLTDAGLALTVEAVMIDSNTTTSIMQSYAEGLPEADIAIFYDYSLMSQMYEQGLLADLSQFEAEYPLLFSTVSESVWNAAVYQGAIIGYPLLESAGVPARESSVLLRSDILEELGRETPKTPEELLELCMAARDAGLPCDLVVGASPPYAFHRTYAEWPFYTDPDSLVLIDEDGEVGIYAESEIFLKDTEFYGRFKEEGVLRGLYFTKEIDTFCSEWDALAAIYPMTYYADCAFKDEFVMVQFAPDRGNMQTSSDVFRFAGVTATADATAAMRFLETLYTDQTVYDALIYGIEGRDWTKNTDDSIELLQSNAHGKYFSSVILNRKRSAAEETVLTKRLGADTLLSFNPGAYSYRLDMQTVNRIYTSEGFANLASGILFIRDGRVSVDRLPQAVQLLRDSGIDSVVEQYREGYGGGMAPPGP